jgi:hypothetical protein
MTATSVSGTGSVADDVRIATIHLRLGQLTLARAELEDLLGRDALDTGGLAALAEARWRTGDGDAASAAAEAHLEAGGTDPIAICIAAEAAAAEGRPGDARILMDRLPIADAGALDALFAGMPRRAFWPAGPVDRTEVDEIRREQEARAGGVRGGGGLLDAGAIDHLADAPTQAYRRPEGEGGAPGGTPGIPTRAVPGPREVLEASGAWADIAAQMAAGDAGRATAPVHHERRKAQLDPRAELDRAREELDGRPDRAFLRMALALRADPTLAPAVLEAVHLRREPAAALLRGDAQRLLGRHLEAEAAFDSVADTLESS